MLMRPRKRKLVEGSFNGLYSPEGITVDDNGNIYVLAKSAGSNGTFAYKYNPEGKKFAKVEVAPDAKSITVDKNGNFYVTAYAARYNFRAVQKYSYLEVFVQ